MRRGSSAPIHSGSIVSVVMVTARAPAARPPVPAAGGARAGVRIGDGTAPAVDLRLWGHDDVDPR